MAAGPAQRSALARLQVEGGAGLALQAQAGVVRDEAVARQGVMGEAVMGGQLQASG